MNLFKKKPEKKLTLREFSKIMPKESDYQYNFENKEVSKYLQPYDRMVMFPYEGKLCYVKSFDYTKDSVIIVMLPKECFMEVIHSTEEQQRI